MLPIGTSAPDFDLPGCDGKTYRRDDFSAAPALLVIFICNHCPYVVHVREKLVEIINEYRAKGVAVVAVNSNDAEAYPDDKPEYMVTFARDFGYTFPYLIDSDQQVAKTYHAACTPDFFLFDAQRRLAYRGQMDDSRPGNTIPVSGRDLRAALDAVLEERLVTTVQKPSMGCNIKWKTGNEPVYYSAP